MPDFVGLSGGMLANTTSSDPRAGYPFCVGNSSSSTGPVNQSGAMVCGEAGTFSKLAVFCVNTTGTDRTVRVYKNGSAGNQTIAVADGVTGWFEDASNTDTVSVGDNIDIAYWRSGATNWTARAGRMRFTPSSGNPYLYGHYIGQAMNGTFYVAIQGYRGNIGTEDHVKLTKRVAGTAKYLSAYVDTNSSTSTTTIRFRKNNANGNQVLSIGAGTTGRFTDTSNSDSFSAGDTVNYSVSGMNANVNIGRFSLTVVHDTQAYDIQNCRTGQSRAASATVEYLGFAESLSVNATEANRAIQWGKSVVIDRLRIYLTANTYTSSVNFTLRKGGADTSVVAAVASSTTGLFEDTTHSATFEATDDCSVSIAGGTSGSITMTHLDALISEVAAEIVNVVMMS